MITYVINTSENKTFDSGMLFDLAGYSKIRWLYSPLDEIEKCAEKIYEKQNVLGAERFRIAVIVDFFGFDRIRIPYGRTGYDADRGVDMSLYMPYIEIFLLDNLVANLEKQNLYTADFEIYYIQNEKSGNYELFESAIDQLKLVLSGSDLVKPELTTAEKWAKKSVDSTKLRSRSLIVKTAKEIEAEAKRLSEVRCREVHSWSEKAFYWGGLRGVSFNMPSSWVIKDYSTDTHQIVCDGLDVGRIYVGEPVEAYKVLSTDEKGKGNDELSLTHEVRIIKTLDEDYICRHLFKITANDAVTVKGEDGEDIEQCVSKSVCVEVNYDQLDADAVQFIENNMRIGYVGDKNFDKELLLVTDLFYRSFTLHCTPAVSLVFKLIDFPYGASEMTFMQFWDAFRRRSDLRKGIRRHYYVVPFGIGTSRAALDALSLSLHLIRMYEREEFSTEEGDMDVLQLDSVVLKDVLETAWGRVMIARNLAKNNKLKYYSLTGNQAIDTSYDEIIKNLSKPKDADAIEAEIIRESLALPKEISETKLSADKLYDGIMDIADCEPEEFQKRYQSEFDSIMSSYLEKRDATKATDVEEEFVELKAAGLLEKIEKCPSKSEYNHLVEEKKKEISVLFESALSAEYITVDYKAEKARADEAFNEYKRAKACLNRNIIGDIVFLLLSVAAMVVPYILLQLTSYNSKAVSSTVLGLTVAGIFGGIFVLSVLLKTIPLVRKMNKLRAKLKREYIRCNAKERHAFSDIRRKYEKDLIAIERARYDIRQLKHLYDANVQIEKTVGFHREMLDKLEECLSVILNNLDVEPAVNKVDEYDVDIDFSKPIRSKENKIYQIFSIETIEKMFPKKGRD